MAGDVGGVGQSRFNEQQVTFDESNLGELNFIPVDRDMLQATFTVPSRKMRFCGLSVFRYLSASLVGSGLYLLVTGIAPPIGIAIAVIGLLVFVLHTYAISEGREGWDLAKHIATATVMFFALTTISFVCLYSSGHIPYWA